VGARCARSRGARAHTFAANCLGRFEMIAVVGDLDCRFEENRVEFTWTGNDEMDDASGRGWATLSKDGALKGRIYFHHGDDSSFIARRGDRVALHRSGDGRGAAGSWSTDGRSSGTRAPRTDVPCV
jgi:hypothetical protein